MDNSVRAEKQVSCEPYAMPIGEDFFEEFHRMKLELQDLQCRQDQSRQEVEAAIERANRMTVEAEVANIELK